MSKRKIVSFLLLLLLTVSVFIANIIIIENAKGIAAILYVFPALVKVILLFFISSFIVNAGM